MAALAPPVRRATSAPAKSGATASHDRYRPKRQVRPKLKVSQPSDALERDADRAADRVMRSTGPTFPMAGPRGQQDEKAKRSATKDEHPKRAAKPERVKRSPKPERVKRSPIEDEHAKRKTKEQHAKHRKDDHPKRKKDDSK